MSNPFKGIVALVKREPAVLLSLAGAGIGVGADFGLHLSASQQRGVYSGVAAITGFLIRATVTPTSSVNARLDQLQAQLDKLTASLPPTPPTANPPLAGAVKAS